MVAAIATDTRPFISSEGVRNALDNLLYTSRSNPVEALQLLTLVDDLLVDPNVPPFETVRQLAIERLLTDYITEELRRLRRILSLAMPTVDTPLQTEIDAIQQDGMTQSSNLLAWSYLYYRYVRVDLNLSPENYAKYVQVDVRTLRRYLDKGIRALTDKLASAEWQARAQRRQRRLYQALPIAKPVTLFGRNDDFTRSHQAFRQTDHPRHFLITGAPGSGKSTFAQEIARQQIDDLHHPIEQIIWQDAPISADDVLQFIAAKLYAEETQLSLSDYLSHYRTLIVLDHVDALPISDLEQLLRQLSAAEVILISNQSLMLKASLFHFTMNELNFEDTRDYVASFNLGASNGNLDDYTASIRAVAGGNPLAIKLAADAILLETDLNPRSNIAALFSQRFEVISESAKSAWVIFALLPEQGLATSVIRRIWQTLQPAHLTELTRQHILMLTPDECFTLTTAARHFIEQNATDLQPLIDAQITALVDAYAYQVDEHYLRIIEAILFRNSVALSPEIEAYWLALLNDYKYKDIGRWLSILERRYRREQLNTDDTYHLEYGRMLRRLNRWEQSQLVLEQLIAKTGAQGDFTLQSSSMIELAILLRIRGAYDGARKLLEKSATIAKRYHDAGLIQYAALELAQLEIDCMNGAAALELLDTHNLSSGRALALMAEALLNEKKASVGISYAQNALRYYTDDRINYALTAVLLGRLYYALNDYPRAHDTLAQAITILEVENYPFALARARMNMALVLIKQDETPHAKHLLKQAATVQTDLRDTIGLTITRHNLEWLENA